MRDEICKLWSKFRYHKRITIFFSYSIISFIPFILSAIDFFFALSPATFCTWINLARLVPIIRFLDLREWRKITVKYQSDTHRIDLGVSSRAKITLFGKLRRSIIHLLLDLLFDFRFGAPNSRFVATDSSISGYYCVRHFFLFLTIIIYDQQQVRI